MAENEVATIDSEAPEQGAARVYEIGYLLAPSLTEEGIEKAVSGIRQSIEKEGGSFVAEGAPSMTRLSYAIETQEGGKRVEHDRAYFGWIKFELGVEGAKAVEAALKSDKTVIRYISFRTVREDTRAKMKAPTLREVKRTDTIKSAPRRAEESAAPVSEEDLDKALQDITAE